MLGVLPFLLSSLASAPHAGLRPALLADASSTFVPLLPAALILLLCVVAGIGTVLLLPGKREATFRKVGGALLGAVGLIFAALLFRAAAGEAIQGAHLYFWPFAVVALVSAIRVVTHPRPVYSALYFVLTTFATAGLFVLLWAEFMAAALILIYAGAILVTYVFVIMLAQQATTPDQAAEATNEFDAISREPVVAATIGFTMMAMLLFVILDKAGPTPIAKVPETDPVTVAYVAAGESTQSIGRHLFEYHLVNLELAGLLLTVATVGAIVISRRRIFTDKAKAMAQDILHTPATPIDDNPHSIPVYGTDNPGQKAYPET